MRKLTSFGVRHGPMAALYAFILAVLSFLYGYGSRSFMPKMSPAELQIIHDSKSLTDILHNPLWLPYKLISWVFVKLGAAPLSHRFISAFFATCAVFAFYSICRRWYRPRIAALTTCLFAVSATTLTLARVATPAILLYTWLAMAAAVLWFRHTRKARFAPLAMLLLIAGALYIPGAIWFLVLMAVWFWRDIPRYFKFMKRWSIVVGALLGLLVIAPLVYAFVKSPSLATDWALLPSTYNLQTSLLALRDIPAAFFYRSAPNAAYNLGTLPILDAFSGTMLLIGFYAYRRRVRLERTIVYIFAGSMSIVLTVLNTNQLYLVAMLPFAYLLVGEGMTYLIEEWRRVFPRNPLARFIGTLILSLTVLAACTYQMNRFYLAWQNAPATKAIYSRVVPIN